MPSKDIGKDSRAELVLNSAADYQTLSSVFVDATLEKLGIGRDVRSDLSHSLNVLVQLIARKSQLSRHDPKLKLRLGPQQQHLLLELLNYGEPLAPKDLSVLQSHSAQLRPDFENLGRAGQKIKFDLGPIVGEEKVPPSTPGSRRIDEMRLESRQLRPGEEQQVSEIFYRVYGYNYINEVVYHPERLRELIDRGDLISVVTVDEDQRVLGHAGLLRLNQDPPVFEAALGVSDPDVHGAGIFKRTFELLAQVIQKTPMQYCVYDFVTNHDRSQRLVDKFGYAEMCIQLGSQQGETQARLERLGMGPDDPNMNRYSLLVGIGSFRPRPFGRGVWLPTNLGEACGFLLAPFDMSWTPTPRFYPLHKEGDFRLKINREQASAVFDFFEPGQRALRNLLEEHKRLLREGIQYVAVEMPLDRPGIGQVFDALAQIGFFISGFIPYNFSDRIGFRFQFLLPTKVSFEGLRFYKRESQKLLEIVMTSFERNAKL